MKNLSTDLEKHDTEMINYKKLDGKWEEIESYNNQKLCRICKQKFRDVYDSINDSNRDSNDKEFDLKKSHDDDHKFNDCDNDSNVKVFDLIKILWRSWWN